MSLEDTHAKLQALLDAGKIDSNELFLRLRAAQLTEAKKLTKDRTPVKDIAKAIGLSLARTYVLLKDIKAPLPGYADEKVRNVIIAQAYLYGSATAAQLVVKYGVSKQRVHMIVKKYREKHAIK